MLYGKLEFAAGSYFHNYSQYCQPADNPLTTKKNVDENVKTCKPKHKTRETYNHSQILAFYIRKQQLRAYF
jgi:hypothetical protein